MEVQYASKDLGKTLTDDRLLRKKYGKLSDAIKARLADLRAVETLDDMRVMPGRIEELKQYRRGQFSIRISANWRMILMPANDPVPTKPDGGIDWTAVTIVEVLEMEDYH